MCSLLLLNLISHSIPSSQDTPESVLDSVEKYVSGKEREASILGLVRRSDHQSLILPSASNDVSLLGSKTWSTRNLHAR